jgi:excisionase family DNA binding protein
MQRQTITVKEAAEYIGVSKDTIYEMVRRKEIPHSRAFRRILFRIEALDRWMNEQEKASVQQGFNANYR